MRARCHPAPCLKNNFFTDRYFLYSSDRVILAMKDYLVSGHSRKDVCEKYQMNNGYFSTTLGRLTRLNVLVARLAPYYTDSVSAIAEAASL